MKYLKYEIFEQRLNEFVRGILSTGFLVDTEFLKDKNDLCQESVYRERKNRVVKECLWLLIFIRRYYNLYISLEL